MAVIQFLLGVDAPVSWLLIQQIILQVLVNSLIALPVYEIVRRCSTARCRGDPRRRRGRAYTTGALSPLQRPSERHRPASRGAQELMIGPMDERTPPMTPQLALRVAIVGGLALVMFAVIFFRLWFLQVLSGSQYVAAGTEQHRPRRSRSPRRAGRSRPQRHAAGRVDAGAGGPDRAAEPARRRSH